MPDHDTESGERFDEALTAAHRLLDLDGVEGVGQGATDEGDPCILLLVARLTDEARTEVPAELGGFPVVLHDIGSPPVAQPDL